MHAALERLVQHLDEHDIGFHTSVDAESISVDFRGDVSSYRLIAVMHEEDDVFEVFGCPPFRVPAGARPSIAEAVARANYGLQFGKMEMDFDDGGLRYQVSQLLPDGQLTDAVIARTFGATIAFLDRYLPALLSVIYGNEPPRDAINRADQARATKVP